MGDCRTCGAPTEIVRTFTMGGADYDGTTGEWVFAHLVCVLGHRDMKNLTDENAAAGPKVGPLFPT